MIMLDFLEPGPELWGREQGSSLEGTCFWRTPGPRLPFECEIRQTRSTLRELGDILLKLFQGTGRLRDLTVEKGFKGSEQE